MVHTIFVFRFPSVAISLLLPFCKTRTFYQKKNWMMELYPQAKQQRPGVEFIPVPYRSPAAPGKGEK